MSAQQCMNWYVSIPSAPSLSETQLYGPRHVPGGHQRRGRTVAPGDGWHPDFVNGSNSTARNSDHTLDDLGTISGTGRVSMSTTNPACILVPGGGVYSPSLHASLRFRPGFHHQRQPQQVTPVDGILSHDRRQKFILPRSMTGRITTPSITVPLSLRPMPRSPWRCSKPAVHRRRDHHRKPFPTSAVQIFSARDRFG